MINNEISNMKIVHILNSLKGGGIQNFLLSLAPEQVIKGCQVLIIVVDNDDYEYCIRLKEKFENNGVRVCYLNKKLHSKISFLKTLIKCRNIIKKSVTYMERWLLGEGKSNIVLLFIMPPNIGIN